MNDSASLSLRAVLVRADDLRYRQVLGEGLAVRQSTAEVVGFNEVASRVVELIDGQTSINDLVKQLLKEYEVEPSQLESDVLSFLAHLLDLGVVNRIPHEPVR
ncbi:MAG: PqqD family protein [bacterium]|nr:PqqD family protein [bacterium]